MSYVASFDIGTTSVKGILLNHSGVVSHKESYELKTIHGPNGEMEQNPLDWWCGVITIATNWWNNSGIDAKMIKAITFCGQMQDVIPIRTTDKIKPNAILYSDSRAGNEARQLDELLQNIKEVSGNHIDAASPFAKLQWLKKNDSEMDKSTQSILFSAKDFIIYRLTNKFATDPVTGATTGMMNLNKRAWEKEWLHSVGVSLEILPVLHAPEDVIGYVDSSGAEQSGFQEGTPVLCGSGDAGATTLGAGAVNDGDHYIYLGTTGWVAVLADKVKDLQPGIFNLAHLPSERYISIAPLLNVGNVHRWGVDTLTETKTYNDFERLAGDASVGSDGLLFLPYLNGERFPINDSKATGVYIGIRSTTTRKQMARAILEGLSFSLRQTYDMLVEEETDTITLIGGGANSEMWCQILADVLGKKIRIPSDSEYVAAIGGASSAFIALGWVDSYELFVEKHVQTSTERLYEPNLASKSTYDQLYDKFIKIYPAVNALNEN